MAYEKQNFVPGQKLKAEELNKMEQGIVDLESAIGSGGIYIGTGTPAGENVNVWIDTDEEADVPAGGGVDVTAEVGQTIIVKAVDENGKPTEWEAAEYQPRTHYDVPAKVLVENWTNNRNRANWINYNIIKDVPTVTVVYDGTTYVCPVKIVHDISDSGLDVDYFNIGSGEYPFSITGYMENDFSTVSPYRNHTYSVTANEYAHKIDEKYLPTSSGGSDTPSAVSDWNAAEGEAGYIKNRTHWVESVGGGVILEETTLPGNGAGQFMLEGDITLEDGKTYRIVYNGTEYMCTAVDGATLDPEIPYGQQILFGNYGADAGTGDTGEPFVGVNMPGMGLMVMDLSSASSCNMGIYDDSEIVHKLPDKFLPFKYKQYILEYAASDLTPSGQTGFTASAAKQTEVGNLLAELSALTTIHMNMSVAVPGRGEIMRLPVLFKTKNEALGENGHISAVSYDGVVFLADEEVTTAALGSINIYKSGLMVAPADNYQAVSMLGVKITLDVLYL